MPRSACLNIKPEHQNVFVGTGVKLWANGYDSYYNLQFDASKIQFSSDFGYFNGNTFIPTQIGTVTVNGNLDGAAGTVTLRALDIPYALTITPSVIDLTKNDSCQITVTGKDKDGYSAPIAMI